MILKDLSKDIHNLAILKGWYSDRTRDELNREAMQALTHSELSEALEDVRKLNLVLQFKNSAGYICDELKDLPVEDWKPIGLPSEIADVVIRALDYSQFFGISVLEPLRSHYKHGDNPVRLGAAIARMHREVCDDDMAALIQRCYDFAYSVGFDLDAAIRTKHSYNMTRETRHGGKSL